jgi:hypothetical protein
MQVGGKVFVWKVKLMKVPGLLLNYIFKRQSLKL